MTYLSKYYLPIISWGAKRSVSPTAVGVASSIAMEGKLDITFKSADAWNKFTQTLVSYNSFTNIHDNNENNNIWILRDIEKISYLFRSVVSIAESVK